MMKCTILMSLILMFLAAAADGKRKRPEDKVKCPKVKSLRNFDLQQFLGNWYVIQYYASSEEALAYRCMQAEFTMSVPFIDVTMNFTYSFTDDPLNEQLLGNITWSIPNPAQPAHWSHSEDTYEGIYNTYVVDTDYSSWALLLHCAEKSKSPRYLSSFIMSRLPILGVNVISYLRDKLPRYDIDVRYMFDMSQNECDVPQAGIEIPPSLLGSRVQATSRKHPMKHDHGK
ncbi:PREDICTED: apolipoprotein D [Nicrophorus vespilloides]|uniref:Apolipoprotein D n=1 Tax=Nicrophorus vespilloides TaxID=110193 RepID=A0ABM1ME96_NICVS|nr:PREDICTED: apolipoprotein D [Nicrophorus vespilloides]